MPKVAAVTGANRGLGWGTAQALAKEGYEVALLGRSFPALKDRAGSLEASGARVHAIALDLEDPSSIESAAHLLRERFDEGLDLLVNNAGVFLDDKGPFDPKTMSRSMQINALGPLQLSLLLRPLLAKRKGLVVNVSSGMGALTDMGPGYPAYRISKTALNGVTRYLSQEWAAEGIKVNSVCPGWVRTDMGGAGAERSVEEGVSSILWAAKLPPDGPTGGFFRDGKPLDW